MCYFAYSAVNPEINIGDYEKLFRNSKYHFHPGTSHDIKMAVVEESGDFRLTDGCCDCDFPLCEGNTRAPELQEWRPSWKSCGRSGESGAYTCARPGQESAIKKRRQCI